MEKSLIEYLVSVKYWLKPLCLFLLTTYWDRMGKETEAQRSNLAALCPISCSVLYDTTFWAFAALIPSWWTIFYQSHPLSFYTDWTRVQAPSLEAFKDWRDQINMSLGSRLIVLRIFSMEIKSQPQNSADIQSLLSFISTPSIAQSFPDLAAGRMTNMWTSLLIFTFVLLQFQ